MVLTKQWFCIYRTRVGTRLNKNPLGGYDTHRMKTCITCGMPFEGAHANDVALETREGLICVYDIKDGKIKSPEDIFEGGVQFFMMQVTNNNRDLAERLIRKNMKSLGYWKKRPFIGLDGAEATDQEFRQAIAKLSSE